MSERASGSSLQRPREAPARRRRGRATGGCTAVVIVLAKAPVPGRVKTRLCPPATPEQSARVASAALLDSLDAARAVPGARTVVAFAGDLSAAVGEPELRAALTGCDVVEQRGDGLGERIAAAHADTAALHPGLPTVQIGMDTPQVTTALLTGCLDALSTSDSLLGHATDGGWWVLGLNDPRRASVLADVPMSRTDTGDLTRQALEASGLRVAAVGELTDVDTADEAVLVADEAPDGRFAAVVAELGGVFRAGTPA
ncbi:TIGR04282 family arsenosugar biosynthesis glycosyltransferase [Pseudonocardia endophytica]|uniref:Glycosyltransferase A (GT-A) superfamily protein (DUF2064 family) n=1 Tax=Pseudonocardia endophytica TaxID=401976 RepID=A0A4R1HWT9_PSEEN|nr:DUF2064 domain-containing protein [Pseudonocardia endophytica]TCK27197.1 hypothetical protein EV378_3064 [Pseudonocardia endophytica]